MRSGPEAALLVAADRAGVGPDRVLLLQLILRAVDAESPITHEAAPLGSVMASIPRAIVVLDGHHAGGQPRPRLVKAVCAGALSAVKDMAASRGGRRVLGDAHVILDTVVNHPGGSFQSACGAAIPRLEALRVDLERIVREDVAAYWDASRKRPPDVRYVTREASALMLSNARHENGVRRSVERFLLKSDLTGEALVRALLAPTRRHRVACVVDGADELVQLYDLRPDASQFPLGVRVSGWGPATVSLEAFADVMHATRPGGPHPKPACLLSIDVYAADWESAAAIGRREVTELLDHYVAGHRLVDLRLRTDALVNEVGRPSAHWHSSAREAVGEAYPLSATWPASLGESMRMAHIARTTESPMAAAALAWSSVEAAGLAPAPLSGALALQTLRHRLVHCHNDVVASLTGSEHALCTVAKQTAGKVRSLRGVLERFDPAHPARWDVAERLRLAEAEARSARERLDQHGFIVRDALVVIRAHVSWNERGHLRDLNAWVDLLRPERPTDPQTVCSARAALTALLPELTPAAAAQVKLWRARFARPASGALWLRSTKVRYRDELEWLYATRNLTIHTGQLSVYGDVQLASAASGLADLTLEFLGSWYATAADKKPAAVADSPEQIVRELAQRHSEVERHLGARHALTRLHAEHLTSCTRTAGAGARRGRERKGASCR